MRNFLQTLTKVALFVCLFVIPTFVLAATLSLTPTSGTFEVGDRVVVKIQVSSASPVNAISGEVFFPTDVFSIESVSKAGSILNFWVSEPNFSKGTGALHFEGVSLSGFAGGVGTVVTANLRAVKPGSGSLIFKSSQILANDGQGTDVTDAATGATYSVIPAEKVSKPVVPEKIIPEPAQNLPTLKSPEIQLARRYGEQVILGVSDFPKSQVLLTFISESGIKIFITGNTNDQGEFALLVPKTLKYGVYKVSGVIIKPDLSNSLTSNEITFTIGNIFSDIGLKIWIAVALLILLLIYLLIRRILVKKEAKKAEALVHKSFKILREDSDNTKEVRKDLDQAEELIEKEFESIEKL